MSVFGSREIGNTFGSYKRVSPDGIVYTPAKHLIENSQYNLDLNNDGTTDFVITESNTVSKPNCFPPPRGNNELAKLSLGTSQSSNGFETNSNFVARLTSGSPIGPNQSFTSGSWIMESTITEWQQEGMACINIRKAEGNWPFGDRGYLGLAFVIDGKTHYGWAAIGVHGGYGYLYAWLTGYAYQTIAGKSIKAGQTQ